MCSARDAADEAHARYSSARGDLLRSVAELASTGAWRGDGAGDLASWMCARWQISRRTACELVRDAEALRARPALGEALRSGAISVDQAKALTVLCDEEGDDDAVWLEALGFWSYPELEGEARKKTAPRAPAHRRRGVPADGPHPRRALPAGGLPAAPRGRGYGDGRPRRPDPNRDRSEGAGPRCGGGPGGAGRRDRRRIGDASVGAGLGERRRRGGGGQGPWCGLRRTPDGAAAGLRRVDAAGGQGRRRTDRRRGPQRAGHLAIGATGGGGS
jgi:hypothetical protein